MCVLTLGGEPFAVDLRHVSEVFEVESVTVVPGMPSLLTGVTNLRGTVVSLVDLRGMLGLTMDHAALPFAVVIRQGVRQIGLLVDHVPEIHPSPASTCCRPCRPDQPAHAHVCRPCSDWTSVWEECWRFRKCLRKSTEAVLHCRRRKKQ